MVAHTKRNKPIFKVKPGLKMRKITRKVGKVNPKSGLSKKRGTRNEGYKLLFKNALNGRATRKSARIRGLPAIHVNLPGRTRRAPKKQKTIVETPTTAYLQGSPSVFGSTFKAPATPVAFGGPGGPIGEMPRYYHNMPIGAFGVPRGATHARRNAFSVSDLAGALPAIEESNNEDMIGAFNKMKL